MQILNKPAVLYRTYSAANRIYKRRNLNNVRNGIGISSDSKIFISHAAKFIAIDPSLNFTNGKS
ncbi:hypothetical protein [uncultured Campylobacter sp.]|uniref:hypothetical protein n=1 Tax=uncultured Campylobacter sp. TaxID=218934 RepID=UPI0026138D49|nr:hypothetical protein [uncultured Campylobacter sp.]